MALSIRDSVITGAAIVGLSFVVFLFGGQTVHAQLCDGSGLSGPIKVIGPKGCAVFTKPCGVKGGTAGCPCVVSGTGGGSVKAFCSASKPCCEYGGSTSASSAAAQGGMLGQLMQMLQQLMQGGGGGGGGDMPPPPNFDYGTGGTDDNLLDIDPNLLGADDDFNLDAVFGDGDDGDGTEVITDENGNTGIDTDGDGTVDEPAPGQEGDTVVTTYEYAEAVGDNPIVGDGIESDTYASATDNEEFGFDADTSEFDADFAGAYLDPSDGTVAGPALTLEELEAAGLLEAYRLGATGETHSGSLTVPYESLTPAEIRSLQDYHSSAVAVSGKLSPFQGNPLSNEQYDRAHEGEGEQGENILSKLIRFLAALFGVGPPQN